MKDPREIARKRVNKKKKFYKSLASYLVMSVFFVVLNLATSPGHWWFYWPIMGWGIGIVFQFLDAFGVPGLQTLSDEWENRALGEEMDRLDRKKSQEKETLDEELELKEFEATKSERQKWNDSDLV